MSLRTYQLITHPAFLRFIESSEKQLALFRNLSPTDLPSNFPKISSPHQISAYLGVNPLMMRSFVSNKKKHYRSFSINKRSGGKRYIDAPRTFLKVCQWWILDTILDLKSDLPFVYGFSKGKSFVDNAKVHFGAKHILNVDIENFFASVGSELVYRVFIDIGYNSSVSRFLTEVCTLDGALPQGAPTSPKLSNFIFFDCDLRLKQLADKIGATYTRYADDMTFSSLERIPAHVVDDIDSIIADYGFSLNRKKTRFMGANQVKEVTGLVLGRDGIALPQSFLNGTRGWFHNISELPEIYQDRLNNVLGTICLLEQVGGRGTQNLILAGRGAVQSIRAVAPPKLEWGDD